MIRRSFLKLMSLLPFVGMKTRKTEFVTYGTGMNPYVRYHVLSDGTLLAFRTEGAEIRLQAFQRGEGQRHITYQPIGEPVSYGPGTFISDVYAEKMVHIVYWNWNGGDSVTVLSATSGPRAAGVLGWSNVVPDGSGWSYPVDVVGG